MKLHQRNRKEAENSARKRQSRRKSTRVYCKSVQCAKRRSRRTEWMVTSTNILTSDPTSVNIATKLSTANYWNDFTSHQFTLASPSPVKFVRALFPRSDRSTLTHCGTRTRIDTSAMRARNPSTMQTHSIDIRRFIRASGSGNVSSAMRRSTESLIWVSLRCLQRILQVDIHWVFLCICRRSHQDSASEGKVLQLRILSKEIWLLTTAADAYEESSRNCWDWRNGRDWRRGGSCGWVLKIWTLLE